MLEAKNKLPLEGLNKILIRGTNWIGDAVMTLPAVASVRAAYPGAHLSVLAKPPVSDIYKMFSAADEILAYSSKFDNAPGVLRLAYSLRSKKFDAAILLQNAIEAAIIALAAGIRVRAGYNSDGRGFLLTHPVRRTTEILRVHQIGYYLEMVKALGCANVERSPHLETFISAADATDVVRRHLTDMAGPFIGIAPGAAYGPAKRWLPERFAQAGDRLAKELNAQVLLFGGRDDWETTEQVREQAQTNMINLADTAAGFVTGAFLASGSVNDPKSINYHLEIVTSNEQLAQRLSRLIERFDRANFTPKVQKRRNKYIVYLKKSDQIGEFLIFIGAINSSLYFENIRIERDMQNVVNRMFVCDEANYAKTLKSSKEQIENIKIVQKYYGAKPEDNEKLATLMELRLEKEDATLSELADLLTEKLNSPKPISKSNVNHLFIKLRKLAEPYKEDK